MTKQLAPIVLFAYNRPLHMLQVLNALAKNVLAKESILYIYCDGQKPEATREMVLQIEKVKEIAKSEYRFKQVIAIEQQVNKGLANSIIHGITEIINKHGKVIVLEDDILPSIGFLKYMNDALGLYEKEEKVGCIHAWNYNLDYSSYAESTFFLKGADCWGWATWKRSWDLFNPGASALLANIESTNSQYEFDRRGTHKYTEMLKDQINSKVDSWAIRWHASLFLAGKYCLQPTRPIVKNIGLDNSGVHCGISDMNQKPVQYINIIKINNIKESEWFYRAYKDYIDDLNKVKVPAKLKVKNVFKQLLPPVIITVYRKIRYKNQRSQNTWSGDYSSWAEAKTHCTGYDADVILSKCKEALLKVKNGSAVYERDSVLFDEIQYNWMLLAALQKAAMENDNKLCILDFGGSLGSTYYQNKEFINSLKELKWCIVEQEHFVKCGKEYFENEQLKFYSSIEECLEEHRPNVLLLSSVLQYLEKPYDWIEKFVDIGIPYIIIDRTAFIDIGRDLLTIQYVDEKIYDASYPAWFFNEAFFDRIMNIKYKKIASSKGSCDHSNILASEYKTVLWRRI